MLVNHGYLIAKVVADQNRILFDPTRRKYKDKLFVEFFNVAESALLSGHWARL